MSVSEQEELKTFSGQGGLKTTTERVRAIYRSMQYSDCSFRVGPSTSLQRVFQCHKLILTMSSAVFEAMLYGQMAEQKNPIDVPDIEPHIFALLLVYLYTDNVQVKTFEEAIDLCYAAQKYLLSSLVDECVKILKAKLTNGNVLTAHHFATLIERSDLKNMCVRLLFQ